MTLCFKPQRKIAKQQKTYCSVFQINLVSKNNKWEVLRVPRTRLDEKLISPTIQRLEGTGLCYIKYQHTTISTTIKCHTQTLKSFLSSCIPYLPNNESKNNLSEQASSLACLERIRHFAVELYCTNMTQKLLQGDKT